MSKDDSWNPTPLWGEILGIPPRSGITRGKPKPKNVRP